MRVAGTRVAVVLGALCTGMAAPAVAWSAAAAPQEHVHPQEQEAPPAEPVVTDYEHAGQATPADEAGLPPITAADRAAAFPDLEAHVAHGTSLQYFVLANQLEWQDASGGGTNWDSSGWVGYDRNRLWLRTEGETSNGDLEAAEAHVLYGRAIGRWWDVVAGLREDIRPGSPQTWAAVGLQGLAPYRFEVEATGYVGTSGRTQLRLEAEYELFLTNRLIAQPLAEVDVFGKADPEHGIGAGLSALETGLRLRYELRRELAPYVGVTWNRLFGGTADLARADRRRVSEARLVAGVRLWR